MDKNSSLNEEPLVANIKHENTTCVVGWTNFSARLNPAGMALLQGIDPKARFVERYGHTTFTAGVVQRAKASGLLNTLRGFTSVYEQTLHENDTMAIVTVMAVQGFPYEIDVKQDSPLVGWFTVMKERD
jgi:hypothetical protein